MLPILNGRIRPASFRGVAFHVEVGGKTGGRRLAPHEFPKRDEPYTEDMGRKGKSFPITAYLIGEDWREQRDALTDALDAEGPGLLVHPTLGEFDVCCGPYTAIERREKGGFCEVEIQFLEAGGDTPFTVVDATQDLVRTAADAAEAVLVAAGNAALDQLASAGRAALNRVISL